MKRFVGCILAVLLVPLMLWGGGLYAQYVNVPAGPSSSAGGSADCPSGEYIELNTDIPFIGKKICKDVTVPGGDGVSLGNAFPKLMGGLMRVVMAAVVIVAFLAILTGGFMVAMEGAASTKEKGLNLIKLAIAGLILVGISGIILNLINPNFFLTDTGGLALPSIHYIALP